MIPRNVRVSEAPSYGKPMLLYDLECAGSQAYIKLAPEIIERERRTRPLKSTPAEDSKRDHERTDCRRAARAAGLPR